MSGMKSNSNSLKNYFDGEYVCYTTKKLDESSVNLGFAYMNKNSNNAGGNSCVGESITVKNLEVGEAIKSLNADVLRTEVLDNGTIVIYAISNKFAKNEQESNLQIAVRENDVVIGWPTILGSF